VRQAWNTLGRTPDLLPVLKEAGVVDAGGQGLCVIFEGILRHSRGERTALPPEAKGEATLEQGRVPEGGEC